MKKVYSILMFVMFFGGIQAQSVLDTNNISASLSDNGIMFNSSSNFPGYEVPKGSDLHTIFSSVMWYGGEDAGGQLKMATTNLFASSQDVWPGPLTTDGSATAVLPSDWTTTMWTVSKDEIEQHLLNYQNFGYVTPTNISTWPAHGDISQNFDFYLAPFVDSNLDGNYNPSDGDYPCIKGDKATFFIMNDKANVHGSGSDPIGLELHYMFYQYDDSSDLENTTFMDVKMINRGTQTLYDFHVGLIMDGDLGNSQDDYIGCDSLRNLHYYYNDIEDQQGLGTQGYGLNPPSFGTVCLSDNISSAVGLIGSMGFPNTAAGRMNILKGLNVDGSPRIAPPNSPTKFEYHDAPSSSGWSEVGAGNFPGDRRSAMSINIGTLTPSMEKLMTYAVVYNRSGNNNIENVDGLLATTDTIQAFHDNNIDGDCSQSILDVSEPSEPLTFQLSPNPNSGNFVLQVEDVDEFYYSVTDMSGRELVNEKSNASQTVISFDAPAGMYMVNVLTAKGSQSKKLMIK